MEKYEILSLHFHEIPILSVSVFYLQLSHYLDVVEVQIAQQISRRSEAFFHAMTSHDELQEKMKGTCRNIKYLRYGNQAVQSLVSRVNVTSSLVQSSERYKYLGGPPYIP